MYLGACFIFAFLSLAKLAIVKYMRKKLSKRERRKGTALGVAVDEAEQLNGHENLNSIENTPEKKPTLTRRLVSRVHLNGHDKYWQRMKVFHVGSQLLLPLAFLVFALFFFFIYPYVSPNYGKCF